MRRVGAPHGLDRRTFKLAEGEDPNFYAFPPLKGLCGQSISAIDGRTISAGKLDTSVLSEDGRHSAQNKKLPAAFTGAEDESRR
jgi:hypothetical protein